MNCVRNACLLEQRELIPTFPGPEALSCVFKGWCVVQHHESSATLRLFPNSCRHLPFLMISLWLGSWILGSRPSHNYAAIACWLLSKYTARDIDSHVLPNSQSSYPQAYDFSPCEQNTFKFKGFRSDTVWTGILPRSLLYSKLSNMIFK